MITKTRIGNHLRRHALGDQPTFRQGFKEGVAFAQKHAALVQQEQVPKHLYDAACRRADSWERLAEDVYSAPVQAQSEPVATKNADGITLHFGWDDLPVGAKLFAAPVQQGVNQQLLEALKRANTLLAELTFSDWIPRTDTPSIDIRQRINAAHVIASSSIAAVEGK